MQKDVQPSTATAEKNIRMQDHDYNLRKKDRHCAQPNHKDPSFSLSSKVLLPYYLLIILTLFQGAYGLIGYECYSHNPNVTIIDTTAVGNCISNYSKPQITHSVIQLVQLADTYPVKVSQCKIVVSRRISHCGMLSYSSEVLYGQATYVMQIGKFACEELHQTGSIMVQGGIVFRDIKPGHTYTRPAVLTGSIDPSGNCKGGTYSDQFGSWSSVVVQAEFKITLLTYTAEVSTSVDEIRLKSGLVCKYSEEHCMDLENGETFWQIEKKASCDQENHIVLYEGTAKEITATENSGKRAQYFMVNQGQKIFALRVTTSYKMCLFDAWRTEHPKLIIIPKLTKEFYFKKKAVDPKTLDLIAYINAKFVYLDRTLEEQIEQIYHQLSHERCMVERETLKVQIAMAEMRPNEFAYALKGKPGYTAAVMGEVIYLIKCNPVEVAIRKTDRCYMELPVSWQNESYFLSPRTRLLQRRGTEVTCNGLLKPMFRHQNIWCSFSPKIAIEKKPAMLNPLKEQPYLAESHESLAIGGIYDDEELTNMRNQIMAINERIPISNIIMRGATGQHPDYQDISIGNMINENIIDQIKEGIVRRSWGYFSKLGNIVSSLIGIYVLFQFIKGMFSILLQGRMLYDTFGISPNLMGALWNPLSNYLLIKRLQEPQQDTPRAQYSRKYETPYHTRNNRNYSQETNELSDTRNRYSINFDFVPSNHP